MNNVTELKPRFLLLSLVFILLLSACQAGEVNSGAYSGTLVLEGSHTYAEGDTLPGVLVMLGGEVTLQPGARVDGQVFLLGGSLNVEGQVERDISAIGGELTLGPGAVVGGDVRVGSGELRRSPQAAVQGKVLTGAASGVEPGDLFPERSLGQRLIWLIPEALILAGLAYLAASYIPRPVSRVKRAAVGHPVVSIAMGLLAGIVLPVLLVVMAFTLILIPVTLLGLVVGFLAIGYGWVGIGTAVGHRLATWRNWALRPPASAFLGTLVFMLVVNLVALIPAVGSLVSLLTATTGLGAVLLTRFGLREFVPES